MGIVSSTFASLAIRFAWNCQRFLDPRYRSIEVSTSKPEIGELAAACGPTRILSAPECAFVTAASPSAKATAEEHQLASGISLPAENNNKSLHQENRRRRAAQHRYRKRPSSFDVSLIIQEINKSGTGNTTPASGLVTHSMPSTLKRQTAPSWESTSSSGSSSESSDSETEFMYARSAVIQNDERSMEDRSNVSTKEEDTTEDKSSRLSANDDGNLPKEFSMSAAEEAAFRITIGRGHFSRSKKDRFLNQMRLEKRLNDLNNEYFELTRRAHTRTFRRRNSGDLRRIV